MAETAPRGAPMPAAPVPEANGTAVLEVAGLRQEFGPLVAVNDVSFRIPEAGSLAIVGGRARARPPLPG